MRTILVVGDILDGHGIYKGQAFEQYAVGLKAQLEAFRTKVPAFKKLQFKFITGNHDESFKKSCGVDIGAALSADRPNWEFLGESYAEITFRTKAKLPFKVTLAHPGGGSAYSLSYRLQKNIESLSGGTKPDARFEGHFHKAIWLPGYRNVEAFSSGTFQSQTPFMQGRGLSAAVGGWEIEATITARPTLTRSVSAKFHSFFEPQEGVN
jgi:hypothetical protein